MILMIDNYDSFTFNVVQYLGELGAEVVVRRNDEIDIAGVEALAPERIVLSPGPCTPNEAGISMALVEAFAGRVPLLGICLGHQCIGQVFSRGMDRPGPKTRQPAGQQNEHKQNGSTHGLQTSGGGGARTSREPPPETGPTTPEASICSTIRAARL